MQVRGKIRSNYALQAHRVTSTREGVHVHEIFNMLEFFSVMSRRGLPTSRRQFNTPPVTSRRVFLHRDVNLTPLCHVATSICTPLCHVATCLLTSRRGFAQASVTSRRHPPRRNVILNPLSVTSRRCLMKLSVTSRRDPARRDVTLF